MSGQNLIETGLFTTVQVNPDNTVSKFTRASFATQEMAEGFCGHLEAYAAELSESGIPTAHFLGAVPIAAENGYTVRHDMEYISGPSAWSLDPVGKRESAVRILQSLMDAPEGPHVSSFATPIDAKLSNYHVRGDEPVLVDICPPYYWDARGQVATRMGTPESAGSEERTTHMGMKSGAMSRILVGSISYATEMPLSAQLKTIHSMGDEWYTELLPPNLPNLLETEVNAQIGRMLLAQSGHYLLKEQSAAQSYEV